MFSADKIKEMVGQVPFWWHTITLPYDIKTPGTISEAGQLKIAQAIPSELKGKRVLDIGTWDGYYAFLCEARGASPVLAIDNLQHEHLDAFRANPNYLSGFDIAKRILNSKVNYRIMSIYEFDSTEDTFDIVLFLGVYYHLEHPFLALRKIAPKTKELLIIEGTVYPGNEPVMKFRSGDGIDPTCWWDPTENCLSDMLKAVGFKTVQTVFTGARMLMRAYKY